VWLKGREWLIPIRVIDGWAPSNRSIENMSEIKLFDTHVWKRGKYKRKFNTGVYLLYRWFHSINITKVFLGHPDFSVFNTLWEGYSLSRRAPVFRTYYSVWNNASCFCSHLSFLFRIVCVFFFFFFQFSYLGVLKRRVVGCLCTVIPFEMENAASDKTHLRHLFPHQDHFSIARCRNVSLPFPRSLNRNFNLSTRDRVSFTIYTLMPSLHSTLNENFHLLI
jgi:hypothetical protein